MPAYYGNDSLSAATYDVLEHVLNGGEFPDLAVYSRWLPVQPVDVLEIACGTGRILWPIAGLGHRVTGLDLSERMLQAAQAKGMRHADAVRSRVRLVVGDMTTFDLGGTRFDVVVAGYFCLNHMLTVGDWRRALARLSDHIGPGGTAIIHVLGTDVLEQPTDPSKLAQEKVIIDVPNQGLQVALNVAARRIDKASGRFSQDSHFMLLDSDGRTVRSEIETLEFFHIPLSTLDTLLGEAGLGTVEEEEVRIRGLGRTHMRRLIRT